MLRTNKLVSGWLSLVGRIELTSSCNRVVRLEELGTAVAASPPAGEAAVAVASSCPRRRSNWDQQAGLGLHSAGRDSRSGRIGCAASLGEAGLGAVGCYMGLPCLPVNLVKYTLLDLLMVYHISARVFE